MALRTMGWVARQELVRAGRGRLPILLGGVVAGVLLVVVLGSWQHHRAETAQRDRYRDMVQAQWESQPDRHPHRVAHYGFLAFRARSPFAVFDPGVDSFAGTTVFLEAHRQNPANFGEARHATGMLRFGELTPAAALRLILPLLIIGIGFATVSRERESGTLALLLAQGASGREILFGKVVGLLSVVALVVAPAVLVGALLLGFGPGGGEVTSPGARAGLLALAYATYLGSWACLVVLVSAWSQGSRGSLVTLLALWVGFCVLVPRSAPALAEAVLPSPTRAEFDTHLERALRAVGDSHNPNDPFFNALRDEYLERYGVEDVAELPVNWGGVVSREGEITTQVFEDRYRSLQGLYARQDRWVATLGLFSPYQSLRDLSMAVAGTDPWAVETFRREAEDYRFDVIQRLNELHVHRIRFEEDRAQRVDRDEWLEFPEFRQTLPGPVATASREPFHAVALALWGMLPLLGLGLLGGGGRLGSLRPEGGEG